MPAYNFKSRFAPPVESGQKDQTIRRRRKRPTKKGDTLYLYVGMRTKSCRLLKTATCTGVEHIYIGEDGSIHIDGVERFGWVVTELAKQDGFDSVAEFTEFFKQHYSLPFDGEIIYWGERP